MSEKIIGYLLLILGIGIIIYSAISVYRVFTNKAKPVALFNFPPISLDLGSSLTASLPPELKQALNQQPLPSQKTEIFPAEILNSNMNIFAHLILMGFMASIGFKIASLGVMFLRPIVVKLKAKEETLIQASSSAPTT